MDRDSDGRKIVAKGRQISFLTEEYLQTDISIDSVVIIHNEIS